MKKYLTLIVIIITSIQSFALKVELSNDTFSTTGRGSNRNLFVTNNSEKMAALEVYSQSRVIDSVTGLDQLDDVEEFLIFPSQLLLQPNEQQVVTLTWVGPQSIESEQAFRIVVEELNLSLGDDGEDLGDGQTSVKLAALAKVVKAAYVSPSNAKPNVKIVNTAVVDDPNISKKMLEITFENNGTKHKIMKQTSITIVPVGADGNPVTQQQQAYMPEQLNGVLNILAKSQRMVRVSLPEGMDGYSEIKASL